MTKRPVIPPSSGHQEALFAISKAEKHANPAWVSQFMTALRAEARSRRFFTSADVIDRQKLLFMEEIHETHEMRAVGAMMQKAAKAGLITATLDWRATGSHGRPQRVWESQVYA